MWKIYCHVYGVYVTRIIGSFDDCVYWHFFTITINYYSSQLILTAEAIVRDTTCGGRNYISDFEGSRALPACPSGIGRAYNRIFFYIFYDSGRGAL
jgi:hypothetical protein